MTDVWDKWEGLVVNGTFPLRRFLGNSDHSVVFLSDYRPSDISAAAIKLVPADPQLSDGQLARWRSLRSLSHPHLLRLFDSGHCQIGGHPFFFVVMEYAEQTLAQVLPQRPLTAAEVRELLPPTLDALEYLHGKQLVQGQLKPANFLVVGDQLKLASDTIRPAGDLPPRYRGTSVYDAPEARTSRSSTSGDTWGLGLTLIETLTQETPDLISGKPVSVSLPSDIAPSLASTIRRCIHPNPAMRPNLADLRAELEPSPNRLRSPAGSIPAERPTPSRLDAQRALKHPGVIAAGILLLVFLGWLGFRRSDDRGSSAPLAASAPPVASSAETPAESTSQSLRATSPFVPRAPASPSVLHQPLPAISRSAQASIHGHFKVSVKVIVDQSGNVTTAAVQNAGPSQYFARLALDAAKQWKFSPSDSERSWQVQFAFSRDNMTAQASPNP